MKGCLSLILAMIVASVLIAAMGPIGAIAFIVIVLIVLAIVS